MLGAEEGQVNAGTGMAIGAGKSGHPCPNVYQLDWGLPIDAHRGWEGAGESGSRSHS